MDAIQSFFRKYGAVPADNAGPVWADADDKTLTEWQMKYRKVCKATTDPHAHKTYGEILEEIKRRGNRDGDAASADIVAAWLSEFGHFPPRVGFKG